MKKIFQFACVAVIALSFVACGFSGSAADGTDSTSVSEISETVVVDTTACGHEHAATACECDSCECDPCECAKACDSTAVAK